ncbi:MAG: hypothetical protein QOI73_2506 [Solirubrobacteraceae bacterium]|nr:hypothetical protein [Solirubrobacteraceae bacterium]
MRGDGAPTGDVTDAQIARVAWAVIVLLALVVGWTAAPASAASTASPALQAASASGTPVIPPPPPQPEPLTCTPSTTWWTVCTNRAQTCVTIGGVRTCIIRRVMCLQIGGYKRCVLITSTCRAITSTTTGRSGRTCRTGPDITIPSTAASIASGSIPRFTLLAAASAGRPSAMRLVSTTTAAAPPVTTAVASTGATVPPGAAIGTLVLVLALAGLTITRRRPRSGG